MGTNNKKKYLNNIYLFILCLLKDNDWNSEYVYTYTMQHLMIAQLVNKESKGIKSERSWHYFSQCSDIGLSVLRRNMIHFTQVSPAILFLSLSKQHNIQTYGEVRHGSTRSRHSNNEVEASTSRSKALEIIGEWILPYILESKPNPFYSFRGLKNQMRIRIVCGLDSQSWAGFWKNYKAAVRAVRTIQLNNLLFYLLFITLYNILYNIYNLLIIRLAVITHNWISLPCRQGTVEGKVRIRTAN